MNEEQLIEWFQKWRKPIRSWMRNRAGVPPGDIDDLSQEVFLRLLRYPSDTIVENPAGYLFRIAANVATEWRERSSVRKPHDDSWLEELVDGGELPEEIKMRDELIARVQGCWDTLPDRQGVILLMHVNDGLTYKQIAADLGLTYRIVLRDLTRAYSTMRRMLDPNDFS